MILIVSIFKALGVIELSHEIADNRFMAQLILRLKNSLGLLSGDGLDALVNGAAKRRYLKQSARPKYRDVNQALSADVRAIGADLYSALKRNDNE